MQNVLLRALLIAAPLVLSATTAARADVTGTVAIQGLGNRPLAERAWAGTRGQSRRLETFSMQFANPPAAGVEIEYMCNVHGHGNTAWLAQGTVCGTSGTQLDGFAVRMKGAAAANYDVYYECHQDSPGIDAGPTKNGAMCGVANHRLEAMMVWIEPVSSITVTGKVHLRGAGTTLPFVPDQLAGTRGPGGPIDGFAFSLNRPIPKLGMEYNCDLGGLPAVWKPAGTVCGVGVGRPFPFPFPLRGSGFAVRLTGPAAANYDVLYLCNLGVAGDSSVLANGAFCGTRAPGALDGMAVWVRPKRTAPANPCAGVVCSPNHITNSTCVNGVCTGTCDVGWGDCNGNKNVDGCEAPLDALPNCGACATTCDDGNACTQDLCVAAGGSGTCRNVSKLACGQGCGPAAGCGYADTDGDGLGDVWETNGYVDLNCNGVFDAGDTPLPGSDPKKPNVYIKYDYLTQSTPGGHSHQPSNTAMAMVQSAFAARNVILNYYPTSDAIPENQVVSLYDPGQHAALKSAGQCVGADSTSFYTVKPAHFPAELAPAYHYALFAHYNTCGNASDCTSCPGTPKIAASPPFGTSGAGELPGNDFIVSLGQLVDQGVNPPPDLTTAGTFMHELGHNLGLRHGGDDDLVSKPNYLSVMNYTYQFGMGYTAAPGPFPTDINDPSLGYLVDYSDRANGSLNEGQLSGGVCVSNGAPGMDETAGLPGASASSTLVTVFYSNGAGQNVYAPSNGTPVDWDGVPPANGTNVFADVTGDGQCNVLRGFSDWANVAPAPGVTWFTNLKFNPQCNTGMWADGAPANELPLSLAKKRGFIHPNKIVNVSVRPGCEARWIAPGSRASVRVAVLGAKAFNVEEINPASLRFAGVAATKTMVADVNRDKLPDLVGEFPMAQLALHSNSRFAALTGMTRSHVIIAGSDRVSVVVPGPIVDHKSDASGYQITLPKADNQPAPLTLAACATAVDQCGGKIDVNKAGKIIRITANEGKAEDMQIKSASAFTVRRSADPKGQGRVYTVTFVVTDAEEGTREAQCRIQVPLAGRPAADGPAQACVGACTK